MDMNVSRRKFNTMFGASLASIGMPLSTAGFFIKGACPKGTFWEYGESCVWYSQREIEAGFDFIGCTKEKLIGFANCELPAGTRFEIRRTLPEDYGRRHEMAWYSSSPMQEREEFEIGDIDPPVYDPALGLYLHGKYISRRV